MDQHHVIREDHPAYPPHLIRPEHINSAVPLWTAFGHTETEASALWIVRLCQHLGGWKTFTHQEVEDFYWNRGQRHGFHFNNLLEDDHIIQVERGRYAVTHGFICRCFMVSPADSLFAKKAA